MNTGYVATLQGSFAGEEFTQTGQQTTEGDFEWFVQPTGSRTATLYEGTDQESVITVHRGSVLWSTSEEEDTYHVSDNVIHKRTERRTKCHRGEFLLAPAVGLALLSDPGLQWYVERAVPVSLRLSEIDITEFVRNHSDADQWGTGFGGRLPDSDTGEGVSKGAVYGDDVKKDPALGEDLRRGYLNQVGVRYYWRIAELTAYLAESGYIAAYADDIESTEAIAWLAEEVEPYLDEDTDVGGKGEEAPEGQSTLGEEVA